MMMLFSYVVIVYVCVDGGGLPSVATGFPHPAGMTAGEAGMAAVGMMALEQSQ